MVELIISVLGNTVPVLAAVSHYTVQTVAFTANATLNPNSGAFSFRPLVTQANSINGFKLKVSDNGTPPLSATQSLSVVVNPLAAPVISSISFKGRQFGFNVNGQGGPDYAIETSTNLTQWSDILITNSPVLPFTWTDATTNSPQRFYHIKLGPPLP